MATLNQSYSTETLVNQRLVDEQWQPVFLLVAETTPDRDDDLLSAIEKRSQSLIASTKLLALLRWANQVSDASTEPFKPAAKRAAALSLAIERASQLARSLARGAERRPALERSHHLDEAAYYARMLVQQLEYDSPAGQTQPALSWAFSEQVTQTWYNGQFDPYVLHLSRAETQALKEYLYVTVLMLLCHKVAIGRPPATWTTIEQRLLQVSPEP